MFFCYTRCTKTTRKSYIFGVSFQEIKQAFKGSYFQTFEGLILPLKPEKSPKKIHEIFPTVLFFPVSGPRTVNNVYPGKVTIRK